LTVLPRLFVLAVALLATACGGGDGNADGTLTTSTLSAEEYARQADELCRDVLAEISELDLQAKGEEILSGPGSDEEKLAEIARLLEDQLQAITRFREGIEGLGRPSTGAEDVDRILEETRLAEQELEQAIDAARQGDDEGFAESMQRYAGYASQSASIARDSELDFAICGAGA
jgi:hypothetical protein